MKLSEGDIKSFSEEQENVFKLCMTHNYAKSSLQVKTKGENFEKFLQLNYSSSR